MRVPRPPARAGGRRRAGTYARAVSHLPLSARFAVAFSAWAAGRASLDDARDAIVGDDAAHDITGIPGAVGAQPLIIALGTLRSHRATGAGLALPVPGDLVGLGGPAEFNAEVIDVGEGVVVEGADLGLVPHQVGAGVQWTCHRAISHRQLPDASEAEAALRQTLLRTAETLADLDVARWRPEVADELVTLRNGRATGLPDVMHPRAARLASDALRCRSIVDLALQDDGGSVSAAEADARRSALLPLERASRRALVAACSASAWPV
jgi:hypothetical protein